MKIKEKIKTILSRIRKSFVHVFGGNILRENFVLRNLTFIIAIVILMIVFTGYRYDVLQKIVDINRLNVELQDAKYESLAISSELTRAGRQEVIERRVRDAGLDLQVTQEPVYQIQRRGRRR
jgi:hypothetical protein